MRIEITGTAAIRRYFMTSHLCMVKFSPVFLAVLDSAIGAKKNRLHSTTTVALMFWVDSPLTESEMGIV